MLSMGKVKPERNMEGRMEVRMLSCQAIRWELASVEMRRPWLKAQMMKMNESAKRRR